MDTRLAIVDVAGGRQPLFAPRRRGAGGQRRDLQRAGAAPGAGRRLRHPVGLRAGGAPLRAGGGGLRRRAAGHVRHRHPRPRGRPGAALPRPVRDQAALLRPDRGAVRLRLRTPGPVRRGSGRTGAPRRRHGRAYAAEARHRRRDDLRRRGAGGAWRDPGARGRPHRGPPPHRHRAGACRHLDPPGGRGGPVRCGDGRQRGGAPAHRRALRPVLLGRRGLHHPAAPDAAAVGHARARADHRLRGPRSRRRELRRPAAGPGAGRRLHPRRDGRRRFLAAGATGGRCGGRSHGRPGCAADLCARPGARGRRG